MQVLDTNNYVTADGAIHHNSGKSVACCCELMRIAMMQEPDSKGYRKSRFAIVRNTSPELKTTTINTWREWFPEESCGPVKMSSPIRHHIKIPPRRGQPGIDAEFLFIPLDSPKDVKKLRSLELTAAWINEASEVPFAIIDMMRKRVGRYPSMREGVQAVRHCVILDMNAVDEDHWLAQFYHETPHGWAFYIQPPGVLEVEPLPDGGFKAEDGQIFPADAQVVPECGRLWITNPKAENLKYLIKGYYEQAVSGSSLDVIQRDLQGKFVYVQDGKPVTPQYNDEVYSFDDLPLLKDSELIIGADIGGSTLNPAFVIAQRHPRSNWLIHDEVVCTDMGLDNASSALRHRLTADHLQGPGVFLGRGYGDPAGVKRDELYETAVFDHLKSRGIQMQPAPSNEIRLRIESINSALGRMIDGKPGLMIHKRCKMLRKALAGSWHYKRLQIAGEERYRETPDKNHPYSDVADACGYLLMGGGEHRNLTKGGERHDTNKTYQATVDFDVFAT